MKTIDPRTVDLDPTEQVVRAWHSQLLDDGNSPAEAVRIIRDATDDGTWVTMVDNRLAAYLIGGAAPKLHDKLAAIRTNLMSGDYPDTRDGSLAEALGTPVTIQTRSEDGLVGVHGGTLRGWSPDGDLILDNLNGSGQGARIAWHKIVKVWH